jgi:hypothetical protein
MIIKLTHLFVLTGAALLFAQQKESPKTFSSPEEARDTLITAAKEGYEQIRAVFGGGSTHILRTGDEVQDKNILTKFNEFVGEKVELEHSEWDPNRVTLLVGKVDWPFPIPLVKNKAGGWYWDIAEGKQEIRRRTIGANELNAMEICRGYVEAQRQYAEEDRDGNGIVEYASRIFSSEGKKDGLYWPGDDSPVAANFAKAVAEGYSRSSEGPKPFHGYYYKILLGQGPAAESGTQDYLIQKLMIGGFALVAWPAEYGVSGIMTFIVNQDGVVYEKDLGPSTRTVAKAMTRFNPDKTWRVAPEDLLP